MKNRAKTEKKVVKIYDSDEEFKKNAASRLIENYDDSIRDLKDDLGKQIYEYFKRI